MKKTKILDCIDKLLKHESRLFLLERILKENTNNDTFSKISASISNSGKCKSSFTKIEFANLFYILMDEGFLFFEILDKKNNRIGFQKFLENNFTYSGKNDKQCEIKNISKEFAESKGYTYREKQIEFLNLLIFRLQERKSRIENW
ncbi:hypothetical protein P0R33_06245 [Flavobacterium sp. YJ01]|uniref:hypothetical protein n=1 Tax=Flavobacterium sp. YJ01 TaxID=3031997 RepID=UPI0023E3D377|nr:hypothetical protein [Flavobacterium sp. YJ01]WET03934.1 hypothetical protein P0R33_06245 [Flavobacterium sp. YJ01]